MLQGVRIGRFLHRRSLLSLLHLPKWHSLADRWRRRTPETLGDPGERLADAVFGGKGMRDARQHDIFDGGALLA